MNTLIKRSMMLGLSLVLLGASVVPACAQKKINKNLAKAALGKKPPMTGTTPVVRPNVPRVPPTLQGVAVPTRTAIAENVLNNTVERKIAPKYFPSQKPLYGEVNFNELIDDTTPEDIAISFDPQTDINNLSKKPGSRYATFLEIKEFFKKTDKSLFTQSNGKFFLDVSNASFSPCYENAFLLATYIKGLPPSKQTKLLNIALSDYKDFINLRNQQIINILKAANFRNDPTTQRTAEEIKSLVENLDPQNPLRKAIEGTLEQNGYIAPAE